MEHNTMYCGRFFDVVAVLSDVFRGEAYAVLSRWAELYPLLERINGQGKVCPNYVIIYSFFPFIFYVSSGDLWWFRVVVLICPSNRLGVSHC